MAKIKMWIVLFIVGIVMILGASEFSRLLAVHSRNNGICYFWTWTII